MRWLAQLCALFYATLWAKLQFILKRGNPGKILKYLGEYVCTKEVRKY